MARAWGRSRRLLIELARGRHADSARQPGLPPAQVAPLYERAARLLEQVRGPHAFAAALHLGIARRELGDLAAAHEAFQQAVQLRPDDSRAQRELAFRLAQVVQDMDAQHRTDMVRLENGIGQIEGLTGQEVAQQARHFGHPLREFLRVEAGITKVALHIGAIGIGAV